MIFHVFGEVRFVIAEFKTVLRRGLEIILQDDKQRQELIRILIMPIQCRGRSKGKPVIRMGNSVIETTQTYRSIFDCDMSDFACGFYDIVYQNLLNGTKLVGEGGKLTNKSFAGDTMNSYKTVAGIKPLKELPEYLVEYKKQYHCLANFWLIPMRIGRTLKEWSKASNKYNIRDYMDRFLELLKTNYEQYIALHPDYFEKIDSFEKFTELHMLVGSYVSNNMEVYKFSNGEYDQKTIVDKMRNNIKLRAETISRSQYAEELWEYFRENKLVEDGQF